MFLGHFAVGFAAKRVAPAVSLGIFFAAAQFADLLWPNLVLLGIERVEVVDGVTAVTPLDFVWYPWSHSLLALFVWGVLFGLLHWAARKSVPAALVLWAVVVSHWVLDALVHRPDLPLTPAGAARFGLGLWNSAAATALLEVSFLAAGVWLYAKATRPRDRRGTWGLRALVGFLVAIFAVNLAGPPPPSAVAVAWTAQAMWLLVLAGFWVDRHRTSAFATHES